MSRILGPNYFCQEPICPLKILSGTNLGVYSKNKQINRKSYLKRRCDMDIQATTSKHKLIIEKLKYYLIKAKQNQYKSQNDQLNNN